MIKNQLSGLAVASLASRADVARSRFAARTVWQSVCGLPITTGGGGGALLVLLIACLREMTSSARGWDGDGAAWPGSLSVACWRLGIIHFLPSDALLCGKKRIVTRGSLHT